MRKDPSYNWPRRGDYQDHIDWFLEKNPTSPREDAIEFATKQMEIQVAILKQDIRNHLRDIKEAENSIARIKNETPSANWNWEVVAERTNAT